MAHYLICNHCVFVVVIVLIKTLVVSSGNHNNPATIKSNDITRTHSQNEDELIISHRENKRLGVIPNHQEELNNAYSNEHEGQKLRKKQRRKMRKKKAQKNKNSDSWEVVEAYNYVQRFFKKYGHKKRITFEGFEHLLHNLGIGELVIDDHDIHDHRVSNDSFTNLHDHHNHTIKTKGTSDLKGKQGQHIGHKHAGVSHHGHKNKRRPKRALNDHHHDHKQLDNKCLSPNELLHLYKVPEDRPLTTNTFLYLCPAILYQLDSQTCELSANGHNSDIQNGEHDHKSHGGILKTKPASFLDIPGKVWGYAILSVTVISLVGLVCVAVVPILNKALFDHLIQVLVALAIGTLTGDALLHLIPHAMISHESGSHDDEADDHSATVWKGLTVLCGLYLFFIAERILAMIADNRKRKRTNKKLKDKLHALEVVSEYEIGAKLSDHHENRDSRYIEDLGDADNSVVIDTTDAEQSEPLKQTDDNMQINRSHDSANHGHSHEAPTSVSNVAWMVIMGDGLHNFTDGLAIGAAFANSLTVGLSTSIAVFCHELPHELGDFAVLLKSGMSVKHALFYNGISSVLCFVGLIIGVAVGNLSAASSWIFALTAGIFIYISLVDMLPEITKNQDSLKCCHLMLHIVGIGIGIGIMLVIALFEKHIKVGET